MADLVEMTQGKTRDLPIADKLRNLLIAAAQDAGVDRVVVTSGGQCAIGTCVKRIGSVRHDRGMAADLQLVQDGQTLNFTTAAGQATFARFCRTAARLGATGLGAGIDYMGPLTVHVGYGAVAVWGKGGKGANAPAWLREACLAGWRDGGISANLYSIASRNGEALKAGPGAEFAEKSLLPVHTVVAVLAYDGSHSEWARIDLEGDGLIDGHVHRAFLAPIDLDEADLDSPDPEEETDTGE